MESILQNYNDVLKKTINDIFHTNLKKQLDQLDINGNVMNYVNLLSNLDQSLCEMAKVSLKTLFETLDKSFKKSMERKSKYSIKSHHERTILTIFGEVSFKRTFYTSKTSGKNYCYVDRLLGLHKYDYFDPYLKSIILEYSADNSMPKTAKYINNLIGNRIHIDDKFQYFSRQTVRNIILNSKLSHMKMEQVDETPEELYIIADEKWIHTQNNDHNDVMEKSIVLFEDIKNHKLVNKMIFASLDKSFLDNALNYINDKYDVEKIKRIYCMGDGASWIKSLQYEFKFHKDMKVIYGLDKFHFLQALHHLCFDEELEKTMKDRILTDMKEEFNFLCDSLIIKSPHRIDVILEKQQYILNNWKFIYNMYHFHLSCPMESQISHNLAALFTSRPKGFSIEMINILTKLRLLYKNKFNIKKLFFHNFNSLEIITINKEELNFDILDSNKSFTPAYKDKLYHPTLSFFSMKNNSNYY